MKYNYLMLGMFLINTVSVSFASSANKRISIEHLIPDNGSSRTKTQLREENLDFVNQILFNPQLNIQNKKYRIHIDDTLLNALKHDDDNSIKRNFTNILTKLSKQIPFNRVQGYSLSLVGNEIDVTPFLGTQAK